MSLQKIPDWFIAKGIRPGGMRMEKYPTLKKEPAIKWPVLSPKSYGEPLSGGDLRYWVGANGSGCYAGCRNCGEVIFKKEERREHLKKGCSKVLTEAYKALLRDRKCVICDELTSVKHFGVPLCSKDCVAEWSFVTRKPLSLVLAIDFVKTWIR
jgi:hypothetical protein